MCVSSASGGRCRLEVGVPSRRATGAVAKRAFPGFAASRHESPESRTLPALTAAAGNAAQRTFVRAPFGPLVQIRRDNQVLY